MRRTRGNFGIGAIARFGVWFLLITERKGFCFLEEEEEEEEGLKVGGGSHPCDCGGRGLKSGLLIFHFV